MFKTPREFLITYDPECLEEHSDSSDFDNYNIPPVTYKSGKHCLITKEMSKKNSKNNRSNRKIPKPCAQNHNHPKNKDSKGYIWKSETIESSRIISVRSIHQDLTQKQIHNNVFNSGDQFITQAKRSFIRHKVIPCLSSMFGRSSNKMSTIKENGDTNVHKDSSCQVQEANWEHRRRRKFNTRQNYTVQPVYALKGLTHEITPFETKNTQAKLPLRNNTCTSKYFSRSSSTATTSSREFEVLGQDNKKFRKRFQSEMRKEYLKYQSSKFRKHQKQQYPSIQGPYQIFTTPYQQQSKNVNTSADYDNTLCPNIPSTSSGFWDYLFDRFNKKNQTQRMEMSKPCHCSESRTKIYPEGYEYYDAQHELNYLNDRQNLPESNSCQCSGSASPRREDRPSRCQHNEQQESMPMPQIPVPAMKKSQPNKKVQCKCYPEKGRTTAPPPKLPASLLPKPSTGGTKPCQEPHSQMTDALVEKYNGEILCIHNPPCILINGCLNFPPVKEPTSVNVWTATTDNKNSFNRHKNNPLKTNCDQGCQYYSPYLEVRQCQTPEYKREKLIQSACNHNPPCEVVRCCYKNRYDPKLGNSCIHEPMCQNVPECVIQGKQNEAVTSCDHRPKCTELPMCTRNYIVLTARDSVGTQARPPAKTLCRHEPPCIMIPQCLNIALQNSCIPCAAVPDCMHQPACKKIPACCRKSTKEMVSVCSQYPNGCRVV